MSLRPARTRALQLTEGDSVQERHHPLLFTMPPWLASGTVLSLCRCYSALKSCFLSSEHAIVEGGWWLMVDCVCSCKLFLEKHQEEKGNQNHVLPFFFKKIRIRNFTLFVPHCRFLPLPRNVKA